MSKHLASSYTFALPGTMGSNGQVLKAAGGGLTTWGNEVSLTAVETKNTEQDTRLNNIEIKNAQQDIRLGDI